MNDHRAAADGRVGGAVNEPERVDVARCPLCGGTDHTEPCYKCARGAVPAGDELPEERIRRQRDRAGSFTATGHWAIDLDEFAAADGRVGGAVTLPHLSEPIDTDDLRRMLAAAEARVAALEGAARAVVDGCWSDDTDARDALHRHWCRMCEYRQPDHDRDCPIAALAALLPEEGA